MNRFLAALLILGLLQASAAQPGAAASAGAGPATAAPARATTMLTLIDTIAPGVNRTTSGFGTATAIVPAGAYVTYLVQSDPVAAGKRIDVWTRSATSDWAPFTTRITDAHGVIRVFARVSQWTGFWAKFAGDTDFDAATGHGRIATTSGTTFGLEVLPAAAPTRIAIGDQRFMFLVRLHDTAPAAGRVALRVVAPGARSVTAPQQLWPNGVAEVVVVPTGIPEGSEPASLRVVFTATRGTERQVLVRTLQVNPGTDTIAEEARAHLDLFLPWLAAEHPEVKLGPTTRFDGTINRNLLVVDHYVFLTANWEIDLSWHIMIAPDDWARIQLRHRGTQAWPSRAFEISSVTNHTTPHAIAPAPEVDR